MVLLQNVSLSFLPHFPPLSQFIIIIRHFLFFFATKLSQHVTELLTWTGWHTSGLSRALQPQLEEEPAYLLLIKMELNQLDESAPI